MARSDTADFVMRPTKFSEWIESMLHYKPNQGYYGDPIPFFWDGVFHNFYLKAPCEPLRNISDHTVYAHASTRDFLHWREHPTAIEPEPGGPDATSCWTGSIFEKDGRFYLFYTGYNRENTQYPQSICLATSEDLDHWTKFKGNPILLPDLAQFRCDWRDPFVFWSEPEQCYMMSITTSFCKDSFWKGGGLVVARSRDLYHWTVGETIYHPGNHWCPECSDIFQMGKHWYLVVSMFHKTCYRIGPSPLGPWSTPRTDSFDGTMNYAAKTFFDGTQRYLVGWIRTNRDLTDQGAWEWAGHMAFPRQLVQDADGTLFVRLPDSYRQLPGDRIYQLDSDDQPLCRKAGQWMWTGGELVTRGRELYGELQMAAPYPMPCQLDLEFTLDSETGSAGLIFNLGAEDHPGYEMAVDLARQCLLFRDHTERYHRHNCQSLVGLRPNEPIRLKVILEETVVEAFVNDRFALAARDYRQPAQPRVGFFVEHSSVKLRNFALTHLRLPAESAAPLQPQEILEPLVR